MYYNDYEDYMRNVLGYSNMNDNTYGCNCGYNTNYYQDRNNSASNIERMEQMYPEVYKIINPMVCRMCDSNTQPVTEYLVEQMTDDIYDNVVNRVEIQNVINLNISTREADVDVEKNREDRSTQIQLNRSSSNLNNNLSKSVNNINTNSSMNKLSNETNNAKISEIEERETRSPQPRRRNRLLRDLIRILIINRLLRPRRPNRPPFRPGPGGPGWPGGFREQQPPMPMYDEYYSNRDYPF